MTKLNLGAGDFPLDGYENLDRKFGHECYPLDYPDDSVEEIRASHLLEHFSHNDTLDVIKDWMRVLKPGGVLKISVPDFQKICAIVASGNWINAEGYIMGGHTDSDDHHGSIFDASKLSELFRLAGFDRVRFWESEGLDTSVQPISLNMCAYKPSAPRGTTKFDGVTFVLATPRYGPSEHHRCIYDALAAVKAHVRTVSGCFWNQHLCNAIETEIAEDSCKYICTLDYDSVFSVEDVAEMYRIMETHPHIGALVPMQSHRGANTPLFTITDLNGNRVKDTPAETFDGITTRITTGHFGLTFIRADLLREMPRPWMVARLAPDNTWGEGHVDADIDFWYKWGDCGNEVHLANHVVIGHIDDMILWPGEDLAPVYQRVSDYIRYGKPAKARV